MNATNVFSAMLLTPILAAPVVYLVGRLIGRRRECDHAANPAWVLALLALVATGAFTVMSSLPVLRGESVRVTVGAISLHMDGVGIVLAGVAVVLGVLVTLFSSRYMAGEEGEEKFYALVTAMTGAMIGLGCASDLFNLWVWFEAMAIIAFVLVAFYRQQAGALEAGVKYLVQSAIGSALVLLGIALVFSQTGALELTAIRLAAGEGNRLLLAAGALFVIGFGVKAALVPLHTWLPDAHSQAPSGISALLSGVLIEAGLVAMLRALGALGFAAGTWGTMLLAFGAVNMLVGNLMALRQTQVKRLLAYSSISHVGYMLAGLGIAITFGEQNGAAGAFFHLITHGLMKGLAFLSAGALLYALYIARGKHSPLMVDDLCGAAKRYPLVALALSVAVLGLGGLPPMAGFMSKWQILVAGAQTGNGWVMALVVFMALNSILSLGYYAPLVNRMYRNAPSEAVASGKPVPAAIVIPLVVLALSVLALGIWPGLAGHITDPAASAILAAFGR